VKILERGQATSDGILIQNNFEKLGNGSFDYLRD